MSSLEKERSGAFKFVMKWSVATMLALALVSSALGLTYASPVGYGPAVDAASQPFNGGTITDGVVLSTTTTNGTALTVTGNGTGTGITSTGGVTGGTGVYGIGGAGSGIGVVGEGGLTNGIGVIGASSGTGTAVYGVATDGLGVLAESDTTSPAKSAFRIVPQDANPATSPAAGDIYVNSSTKRLFLYDGTIWGLAGQKGTATNDSAATGYIGEVISANATSVGSWSTGAAKNITSTTFTAGDWDVSCTVRFNAAAITGTALSGSVSTTTATLGTTDQRFDTPTVPTAASNVTFATPTTRISLSGSSTVYCVGSITFSGGTPTADGYLRGRRVR